MDTSEIDRVAVEYYLSSAFTINGRSWNSMASSVMDMKLLAKVATGWVYFLPVNLALKGRSVDSPVQKTTSSVELIQVGSVNQFELPPPMNGCAGCFFLWQEWMGFPC